MEKMEIGSEQRKELWLQEISELKTHVLPSTRIAICGATGAGKSTTLNAILGVDILPTSGMHACTTVVTEIVFHDSDIFWGDIHFLNVETWRKELRVLLDDIGEDFHSEEGRMAWEKLHAVYPSIPQESVGKMTIDQIISSDRGLWPVVSLDKVLMLTTEIANALGTTQSTASSDVKEFSRTISEYVGSSNEKPGGGSRKAMKHSWWPIISKVVIRCDSDVLKKGAILVDLPGIGDENRARSSIAPSYLKDSDCIFILAPITRAVSEQAARVLLGNAFKLHCPNCHFGSFADIQNSITFIATKCDDISTAEAIDELHLHDNPDLMRLEGNRKKFQNDLRKWKEMEKSASKQLQNIRQRTKQIADAVDKDEAQIQALKKDKSKDQHITDRVLRKRKPVQASVGSSRKRIKNTNSGDLTVSDGNSDTELFSDLDESDLTSLSETDGLDDVSGDDLETLKKIKKLLAKNKSRKIRMIERQSKAQDQKEVASGQVSSLEGVLSANQRETRSLCALKRSASCTIKLKEDFRSGLKELNVAHERNHHPNDSTGPPVNLYRDYANVDLPVFATSSRDYLKLSGPKQYDGGATTFTNLEDTGIPALRRWCQTLAEKSRQRSVESYRLRLRTFSSSVKNYLHNHDDTACAEREVLRSQWATTTSEEEAPSDSGSESESDLESDREERHQASSNLLASLATGPDEPGGITGYLEKAFGLVVDKTTLTMKNTIKDALYEESKLGAGKAEVEATDISSTFANSMHWRTYRSTLSRSGSFKDRDLNVELIAPMTWNMAHSWSAIFDIDVLANFEVSAMQAINEGLGLVRRSCPVALVDRMNNQIDLAKDQAKQVLRTRKNTARKTLKAFQKEGLSCVSSHVQDELEDAYDEAFQERGIGSVARQKAIFQGHIQRHKTEMFNSGVDALFQDIDRVIAKVGVSLRRALKNLAKQVEICLSVVWEEPSRENISSADDERIIKLLDEILSQTEQWGDAT
ncbi:hypothetical protein BD410DRAFT_759365 [Rickenella mellea]|uniref:G domain-containing protein n=1 Tax=Rickenella mellea TaxID=50990 RepID=A0A4R5XG47_9AGAM|nr:hypothetical protein BD410DRAFT_759365 [Rickenella mellea]